MTEITIHTGAAGNCNRIHIDWFDHNNIKQESIIDVNVLPQDKPRKLEIIINGVKIGEIAPK